MSSNATIFGEYAGDYANARPQYPEKLWQWVDGLSTEHAHAWDAGCGNGQASVALAKYFEHVTASDISAQQIEAAQKHPRVSYVACKTEEMQFGAQSLDLVCVAQALHWFELEKFWPLVKNALKPQGVFVAIAYGLFEVNADIDNITQRHFYDVVDPYQAAGNRMIANEYRDITFPFSTVLESTKFAIECDWTMQQLLNYCGTWSAVARMRKEAEMDPISAYKTALSRAWGGEQKRRLVRMPLVIKAGRL